VAHDLARFAQNQFDQLGAFVYFARKLHGAWRGNDFAKLDEAILGFGDDLLRQDQDITIA